MQKGLTLVEVIVYLALLSVLLVGAISAAFSLADNAERNMDAMGRRHEAAFIQEKIRWALANVENVSTSGKGSTLVIEKRAHDSFQVSENPIQIYRKDSLLLMQRGTREPLALNAERFRVEGFNVEIQNTDFGQNVEVELQIDSETFDFSFIIE